MGGREARRPDGETVSEEFALSLAAVALEELSFRRYPCLSDLVHLFLLSIVENFGYRQLTAWWRLKGTISAIRGVQDWGKMTRKRFAVEGEETVA